MQEVEALHREAMELVDQAVVTRLQGDEPASLELARLAFVKEREAADLVASQLDLEPTRSVLHRSAAVLALECAELREAERLIGRALAGNPPIDIANELRNLLLEEIYSPHQAQTIGQYRESIVQAQQIVGTQTDLANNTQGTMQENQLDQQAELAKHQAVIDLFGNKSLPASISSSSKEILEDAIKNSIEKVILPNFISISLILGGVIFFSYFFSIGYAPELEINTIPTLLGISVITGGLMYGIFSIALILPGTIYANVINQSENLRELFVNHRRKTIGFLRLSIAMFIPLFIFLLFFTDISFLKNLDKFIITLILVAIELFIFFSIKKASGDNFKLMYLLLFVAFYSYLFSFVAITLVFFAVIFANHNQNISIEKIYVSFLVITGMVILFNKYVSQEAYDIQNIHKFLKYLFLSIIVFLFITTGFNASIFIPTKIFEIYGWRNVNNASLIVNYEGCEALKKIEAKIISEQCVKSKNFYQVNNLQILSAIGKNYFLRYPKANILKNANNTKSTTAKTEDTYVDFSFPASYVKSWLRKAVVKNKN